MIEICSNCGNYEKDKEIIGNKLRCPKCGAEWEFQSMPLFILTGCSGVGKTTTAIEIMRSKVGFVVLDADIFTCFVNWDDEESCNNWIETIVSISKDIMQSGKPVLWTVAGCLDRFPKTQDSRYFSEIKCLALVCEEESLRKRMRDGRGITDENWINGSCDYNCYFMEHDRIGDTKYETFDITDKTPEAVADYVVEWVEYWETLSKKKTPDFPESPGVDIV